MGFVAVICVYVEGLGGGGGEGDRGGRERESDENIMPKTVGIHSDASVLFPLIFACVAVYLFVYFYFDH